MNKNSPIILDRSITPVFYRVEGSTGKDDGRPSTTMWSEKFYGVRQAPTGWWLMAATDWEYMEKITSTTNEEEHFQKLRSTLHWMKSDAKKRIAAPTVREAVQDLLARIPGRTNVELRAMAGTLTEAEIWKLEHGTTITRLGQEAWAPSLPTLRGQPLGLEW